MTGNSIGTQTDLHKTKISQAVPLLEALRELSAPSPHWTSPYLNLAPPALRLADRILQGVDRAEWAILARVRSLVRLAALVPGPRPPPLLRIARQQAQPNCGCSRLVSQGQPC